jgi:hypothetical protein
MTTTLRIQEVRVRFAPSPTGIIINIIIHYNGSVYSSEKRKVAKVFSETDVVRNGKITHLQSLFQYCLPMVRKKVISSANTYYINNEVVIKI